MVEVLLAVLPKLKPEEVPAPEAVVPVVVLLLLLPKLKLVCLEGVAVVEEFDPKLNPEVAGLVVEVDVEPKENPEVGLVAVAVDPKLKVMSTNFGLYSEFFLFFTF